MRPVRWLHLSDLHAGCRGEELWWQVLEELRDGVPGTGIVIGADTQRLVELTIRVMEMVGGEFLTAEILPCLQPRRRKVLGLGQDRSGDDTALEVFMVLVRPAVPS